MTDLWHELLVTEENEKLAAFQRKADKIAFLIVASDYERIDVEIEKGSCVRSVRESSRTSWISTT